MFNFLDKANWLIHVYFKNPIEFLEGWRYLHNKEDFGFLETYLCEQDRFVTFTQPEELEEEPLRRVVFIDKIPLPPSGGITVKANAFNSTSSEKPAVSTQMFGAFQYLNKVKRYRHRISAASKRPLVTFGNPSMENHCAQDGLSSSTLSTLLKRWKKNVSATQFKTLLCCTPSCSRSHLRSQSCAKQMLTRTFSQLLTRLWNFVCRSPQPTSAMKMEVAWSRHSAKTSSTTTASPGAPRFN